jgi:replicative DNA helicase
MKSGQTKMLSLRNSGDFEANADVVLLIHRPIDLKTSSFTGEDEIIIGKTRDGARGVIQVRYNDHTLMFDARTDLEERTRNDPQHD